MRYGSFDNLQLLYLKTETGRFKFLEKPVKSVSFYVFEKLIILYLHVFIPQEGKLVASKDWTAHAVSMFRTTYNYIIPQDGNWKVNTLGKPIKF